MSALTKITVPDGTTYEFKDALALRAAAAAPEFVESVPYGVGDYCSHDGLVYRCSAAHAAGAWNASHFTAVGTLQTQIAGKVAMDGGSSQQTISLSSGSGTTALGVKSRSTSSYISFTGTSGWLGSYGVTSSKKPTFYNGSSYTLATTDDVPAISTNIATDASSDVKTASPKAVKTFVEGKGYLTQHQDVSGKLDVARAYPAWDDDNTYSVGDIVRHMGRVWITSVNITPGAGLVPGEDPEWSEYNGTIRSQIKSKQDALSPAQMDAVNSGATSAKVATWDGYAAKLDGAAAYPAWSSSVEYEPGAVVSHLGRLWRFPSSSVVTIEGSIYEPVNGEAASSWTEVTVASLLAESRYVLPAATASTLGGVKPDGTTITVSNGVISAVGGGSMDIVTPTVVNGEATLQDMATNVVSVSSAITLRLPAAVSGKSRVFRVRMVVSGTPVPVVTFAAPTNETVYYETGDGEFPVPDAAGVWLYTFRETATGVFKVTLVQLQAATQVVNELPYDAEVQYLESTGTQHVEVGTIVGATALEVRLATGEKPASGARKAFGIGFSINFGDDFGVNSTGWDGVANPPCTQDVFADVRYDATSRQVDGVAIGGNGTSVLSAAANGKKLFLFCGTNGSAAYKTSSGNYMPWLGRISTCTVYGENSTKLRDFIAVRKDGVGYFYDRVSGELFGNSGTGAFVVGPDVSPAFGYVQTGLLALYDGIENAGWGTHNANASTWKDVTGHGYDGTIGSAVVVGTDCMVFDGTRNTNDCVNLGNAWFGKPAAMTVEVVFASDDTAAQATQSPFGGSESGTAGASVFVNSARASAYFGTTAGSVTPGVNTTDVLATGAKTSICASIDGTAVKMYLNNSLVMTLSGYVLDWTRTIYNCYIGANAIGTSTEYHLNGRVFAVRVYNRALTATEVAANYAIDAERFNLT